MKNTDPCRPRLLLIQPPIYDFALYDHYLKPYGLLRLGSLFQKGGWDVEFINALDHREPESMAQAGTPRRKADGTGKFFRNAVENPLKDKPIPRRFARYGILPGVLDQRIAEAAPDLVFITTGMTYWYRGAIETAERVRRKFKKVPIVLGGIYASLMPEHAGAVCGADVIFPGEGIVRENPGAWALSSGLISLLKRFSLPVPESCSAAGLRPLLLPGIWDSAGVVRINSGCPFDCDYCASRKIACGFHPGDPEEAFEALLAIHRFSGTKNFAFYDDALLFHRKEIFLPFLEKVIRSGLALDFYTPNAVHLAYLDADAAEMMKRAGFREIRLGYESASEEFHRKRDGKFDPASFPGKIEILKEAGFDPETIRVYILAGLPGQRGEDVEKSVRFALKSGVRISLAEYSPVPGSPMWEESCRSSNYPLAEEPLYHNNTFFPMEWEGFTRGDLERLKRLTREG